MPPAIERTIYTEEELLSNDEILNEPPPPVTIINYLFDIYSPPQPLSSSIAVSNNNPFFQIFNSTISQPLSSTSSSLSLNRMSGRHGARMNFLQGGDITSRFQQELDEDDSCCFAPSKPQSSRPRKYLSNRSSAKKSTPSSSSTLTNATTSSNSLLNERSRARCDKEEAANKKRY
ncbi:6016_t:CDS:2 [Entrophospora sp. SA101]|nr:6016_t:CDS:2 [Entrophospora sp. SA101]